MEKNKFGYNFIKYLLGSIFFLYYRPKFVNKKVIPKTEPIILCGNHIHLFDQSLPILSTKRMLHYMAKKEYFEGKFAYFFKLTGCISVDRENHGGNSKEEAITILNNNLGIGIYPEGTRNSLITKKDELLYTYNYLKKELTYKEYRKIIKRNQTKLSQINLLIKLREEKRITSFEFKTSLYNVDIFVTNLLKKKIITKEEYLDSLLLPFKYGTVSIAKKTNAYIVPYGIKGKYKFFNNGLKIVFGIPFKIDNMTLEEANERLRKEIINLIK